MKKIKFLNGISATFALAAVALATTFTSCEKEEFNVKFDPSPAKVYFTPTVIDAATNVVVTDKATFTGTDEITGNKAIAAGTREITATVNGVIGKVSVAYPAVEAGQVVALSPVILLSSVFTTTENPKYKLNGTEETALGKFVNGIGHDHDGTTWGKNDTEYFYPFKATYTTANKATIVSEDIYASSLELTKAIKSFTSDVKKEWSFDLKASAWCLFNAQFTAKAADVEITFSSKATGAEVAKVVYTIPAYQVDAKTVELEIPGHEHAYQHGHGHGNNPNAGGGISLAD